MHAMWVRARCAPWPPLTRSSLGSLQPRSQQHGRTSLDVLSRQAGILEKYGVELIGAKLPSIDRAEDRLLFKNAMTKIGLKTPTSGTAESWDDAIKARFCEGSCQSSLSLLRCPALFAAPHSDTAPESDGQRRTVEE